MSALDGYQIIEIMQIEGLSERDWREIRAIARDLFLNEAHSQDQFKIAIQAFHAWITELDDPPELITQEDNYLH